MKYVPDFAHFKESTRLWFGFDLKSDLLILLIFCLVSHLYLCLYQLMFHHVMFLHFLFQIHSSSVISLLQSEIKSALKSAFGILDGPLSVTDWCKGRAQSGDTGALADGSAESTLSECRDSLSTVTLSVEAMSPSQSSGGGTKMDETSQRRLNQDIGNAESEQQSCTRLRPTLYVLPSPAILVGYAS